MEKREILWQGEWKAQHALRVTASEQVAQYLTCFWEWVHQHGAPPEVIVHDGSAEQCFLQLPRPGGSTEENVPLCPSGTKPLHPPPWCWAGCCRQRCSGSRDPPDSWDKPLCKNETPNTGTRRPATQAVEHSEQQNCHREPLIMWSKGHTILRILWFSDTNHRIY